jgi:xylose isomerase
MLGSIDANRGDPQNGWDTDQFPSSIYETTLAMMAVLKMGGFKTGGLNFDAKRRRNSTDSQDIFIAHIGGMDMFALGLEKAAAIIQDGRISAMLAERYSSFKGEKAQDFMQGKMDMETLAGLAVSYEKLKVESGKQELYENILNEIILG